MKKSIFILLAGLVILSGCSSPRQSEKDNIATQILDNFEGEPEILLQHSSWGSREADFFLEDGVWKLKASGTHISEKGIHDWKMQNDKFYVGVMGFAENTDITDHYPSVDNFEIVIKEK